MRTKRIVSVFLAMLMTLSVFGVISASAAVAAKGWDAVEDGFVLDITSHDNEHKEVSWTAFTAAEGVTNSDFWTRLNTTKDIAYKWEVLFNGADVTNTAGISQLADKGNNTLSLFISTTSGRYGDYIVKLTLTTTDGSKSSAATEVSLVDKAKYNETLKKAKEMAANPDDRYTDDFIDALNAAIKSAGILVDVTNPTTVRYDEAVSILNAAMKAVKYQLTGFEPFDNLFNQGTMEIIWKIVDFFNDATDFYNKNLGPDSTIGGFFARFDFGQIFSGIVSAFTALFGLIV